MSGKADETQKSSCPQVMLFWTDVNGSMALKKVLFGDKWIGNKWVRWQEQVLLQISIFRPSRKKLYITFLNALLALK